MTGFLKKRPAALWAAVIWAAGIGTLLGSMVLSTSRAASAAGPPNQTVTANQGAPGSLAWPVTVKPATAYAASCSGTLGSCQSAKTSSSVVVRDISISLLLNSGYPLEICEADVFTASPGAVRTFIPLVKEGSVGIFDYYAGNSQVDLAVPAGGFLGASCPSQSPLSSIDASFQGEAGP